FRALAETADESSFQVDGGALQADRLADAQAGAVEELDERPVTLGAGGGARRGLDQALGLSGRERPRQGAPPPRQLELGGRVVAAYAEQHLVPVEGTERRDTARDRRRREPVGAQRGDVGREPLRACFGR